MCACRTLPKYFFLPISTRSRNSSRHPPHQMCISTGMCQEREKNVRDSGNGFPPGPLRTRRPISAPFTTFGPPSTPGPTSLSVRARLFIGSTQPPLSVTHRDSYDCMLVVWSLRRPRACLSLRPLRTSTRRYASVSNSRDGHVHLLPPSFPIGLTSALGPTAGSVFDSLMSGLSAPILIPPYSTRTLGLLLPDPRPSPRTIFLFM